MLTRLDVIVPPAAQAITLANLKQFVRVDDDGDDSILAGFISVATDLAQQYTGRVFFTQTLRWTIARTQLKQGYPTIYAPFVGVASPFWPWNFSGNNWSIELPRSPVQSIQSVSYGFWGQYPDTFLDASQYNVDYDSSPARIQVYSTTGNVVLPDHLAVQFVAGWDQTNLINIGGTATGSASLGLTVAGQSVSVAVNTGDTSLAVSTALQAAVTAGVGLPSASVLTPFMVQLRGSNPTVTVGSVPPGLTVSAGVPASEIPPAVSNGIMHGGAYLYQNLADPGAAMPDWFYRSLDPYRLVTFS